MNIKYPPHHLVSDIHLHPLGVLVNITDQVRGWIHRYSTAIVLITNNICTLVRKTILDARPETYVFLVDEIYGKSTDFDEMWRF